MSGGPHLNKILMFRVMMFDKIDLKFTPKFAKETDGQKN